MYLRFQNRAAFEKLHLRTRLEDWDMEAELKLATTTDQCFSGCFFQPNLWMLVNPSMVCTWPYSKQEVPELSAPVTPASSTPVPPVPAAALESSSAVEDANGEESEETPSSSSDGSVTDDDSSSSVDFPLPSVLPKVLPLIRVPRRSASHKTFRFRKSTDLNSKWPRPPINYCILISVALRSSHGSLNVQQIYNFIREHFPFFQTAPEGWKNTVRHNLCFSNSFQKTMDIVCGGSKRKSCLWKLTSDGRRKFHEEIQALSEDMVVHLRNSMYKPGLMGVMFEL